MAEWGSETDINYPPPEEEPPRGLGSWRECTPGCVLTANARYGGASAHNGPCIVPGERPKADRRACCDGEVNGYHAVTCAAWPTAMPADGIIRELWDRSWATPNMAAWQAERGSWQLNAEQCPSCGSKERSTYYKGCVGDVGTHMWHTGPGSRHDIAANSLGLHDEPINHEAQSVTKWGNCRCGQVFYSNSGNRETLPHKPGEYTSCAYSPGPTYLPGARARVAELSAACERNVMPLYRGGRFGTVRVIHNEVSSDRTFENETRLL